MYQINFRKQALKDLESIPRKDVVKIKEAIWELRNNPRPHGCLKLKGSGLYRIRLGDYRIVYDIQEEKVTILVVNVRHRKEIYRDL